jgi:hypothetical protein
MFDIEDILENIRNRFKQGKYLKFKVIANWEVESVPTIEYITEEVPVKKEENILKDLHTK